jgi:hypothetical protein
VSSHLVTRPKMQSTCGRRFPSMELHFYIRSAPIFGSALASSIRLNAPSASGKLVELRQCAPWRNCTVTQKLQLWPCLGRRARVSGSLHSPSRDSRLGLDGFAVALSLAEPVATPCPSAVFGRESSLAINSRPPLVRLRATARKRTRSGARPGSGSGKPIAEDRKTERKKRRALLTKKPPYEPGHDARRENCRIQFFCGVA